MSWQAGILALLLCISGASLTAQQITVRSGEHGDFTRLVLDLPAGTEWELDPGGDPGHVKLALGSTAPFDLSQVYDRIDRARIASLTPLPGKQGLDIGLGCDCSAEAFLFRDRMLVVDVRPRDPSAPPEEPVPKPRAETDAFSMVRLGAIPGIGPEQRSNELLPSPLATSLEAAATEGPGNPGAFEGRLAEELAAAATQGLLDAAIRPLPTRQPDGETAEDSPVPTAPDDRQPDLSAVAEEIVGAAVAQDDGSVRDARFKIGGHRCTPDAALDIGSWGGDDALTETIPGLRVKLYGELDRVETGTARDLARAYIRIGFGAEARAVLDLGSGAPDPVLLALANMMDGRHDNAGVFAAQSGCEGRAALWAVLGAPRLPTNAPVNAAAILRTFEELPLSLRIMIGPELATRLAEHGDARTARSVLSRLERATGGTSGDMAFSAARIDRLEGAVDEARAILGELAAGNGPHAAEATAASIEIAAQQGDSVPETMVELSAAYKTELRDTDQGPRMWLAHLRALLANRRFAEAFDTLDNGKAIPEDIRATAMGEALSELARTADDVTFLKYTIADPPAPSLPTELKLSVADRLLGLGLPDEAMTWLGGAEAGTRSDAVQMVRARIYLAKSQPEEAEIALIGLRGDDALRLRAEARRMMGDFEYVRTVSEELGDNPAARDAAWLAGDWPTVAEAADGAMASAAALPGSDLPSLPDTVPSLQLAETLASESSRTRETLEKLLNETRLPDN